MTSTTPALAAYESGADQRTREERRDFAERTDLDALLKWLLSDSFALPVQRAAMWLAADPLNPKASLEVYRELWAAHRRNANWSRLAPRREIRKAITAVAKIHGEQRAAVNSQAAMNGFLNGLAAE